MADLSMNPKQAWALDVLRLIMKKRQATENTENAAMLFRGWVPLGRTRAAEWGGTGFLEVE